MLQKFTAMDVSSVGIFVPVQDSDTTNDIFGIVPIICDDEHESKNSCGRPEH